MERDDLTHILYSSNDASTYPHPPPLFFHSFLSLSLSGPPEREEEGEGRRPCVYCTPRGEKKCGGVFLSAAEGRPPRRRRSICEMERDGQKRGGGGDVEEQGDGETDSILTDLLIPAICFGAPPSSFHRSLLCSHQRGGVGGGPRVE